MELRPIALQLHQKHRKGFEQIGLGPLIDRGIDRLTLPANYRTLPGPMILINMDSYHDCRFISERMVADVRREYPQIEARFCINGQGGFHTWVQLAYNNEALQVDGTPWGAPIIEGRYCATIESLGSVPPIHFGSKTISVPLSTCPVGEQFQTLFLDVELPYINGQLDGAPPRIVLDSELPVAAVSIHAILSRSFLGTPTDSLSVGFSIDKLVQVRFFETDSALANAVDRRQINMIARHKNHRIVHVSSIPSLRAALTETSGRLYEHIRENFSRVGKFLGMLTPIMETENGLRVDITTGKQIG